MPSTSSMLATNAASFFLGTHQYLLKWGFNSFVLSISPIAECEIETIYSFSTQYSAKRRSVQEQCPSGGGVKAVAMTLASKSPVIFEATGGVTRVFLSRAASKPDSEYVLRIWFTVVGDIPSQAASSLLSFLFSGLLSLLWRSTCAWSIFRALLFPVWTIALKTASCAGDNDTVYFFSGITISS